MAASESFETVLNHLKSSNLNFHLEQTPFSAVINLKKSFIKDRSGCLLRPPPSTQTLRIVKSENEFLASELQAKLTTLEPEHVKLKQVYKEALEESDAKTRHIANLEKKVLELGAQLSHGDFKVNELENKIKEANRALQIKHEKVCAENKILKSESEDSKKEITKLNMH